MTPEAAPRVQDRRREDPLLEEILRQVEAARVSVGSMAGRLAVIEREISRTRALWEALRVDDMSTDQKRALLDVTDWWLDRRGDAAERADRLRRAAMISTLLQALTAVVLLFLTAYTVLHH